MSIDTLPLKAILSAITYALPAVAMDSQSLRKPNLIGVMADT
jgi:hypothetical protein